MQSPDFNDLAAAAKITPQVTKRHCGPHCHAYHTVWPFMRLYGVLPSVARDHVALTRLISTAARSGVRRVLVSGAADFGILAYVIDGYSRAGLSADVTVTDLCRSPLELNQWYAARKECVVETVEGDFRAFTGTGYDLVIAHNFLNFFDTEGRRDVASTWARALKPGGKVALFATCRTGGPATSRRFGPAGLDALVEKTVAAKHRSPDDSLIDDKALAALVREFGEKRVRNSLQGLDAVTDPLAHAGLDVVRIDEGEALTGGIASDDPGQRFCILAEKPFVSAA